jgi:hypothetical protein
VSGLLLIAAAGLAVGGSFTNLDRAINVGQPGGSQPGAVESTITTSPWYYRVVDNLTRNGSGNLDMTQFFGVALAVGGALAILAGVLLLLGKGGRPAPARPLGAAAAALLFGAVLTTEMSVVNDLQFDTAVPGGVHSTSFGPAFWLQLAAGVAALTAASLLLFATRLPARREPPDPPTPPYGLPMPYGMPPQYGAPPPYGMPGSAGVPGPSGMSTTGGLPAPGAPPVGEPPAGVPPQPVD